MSSSKKKGRLALKKRTDQDEKTSGKSTPQATILSLFKKQHDRDQEKTKDLSVKEVGDEVMITGVTHTEPRNDAEDEGNVTEQAAGKAAVKRKTSQTFSRKGRLSLSKRAKLEGISNINDGLDKEDKNNDEKQVIKKIQSSECSKPYKLRMHKTVPVIEIASESDTDDNEDDNTKNSALNLGFEDSRNDIVSSGSSDFQVKPVHRKDRKRKAALKTSKTESEIYDLKYERKVAEDFEQLLRQSSRKKSKSQEKHIPVKQTKEPRKLSEDEKSGRKEKAKPQEQCSFNDKPSVASHKGKDSVASSTKGKNPKSSIKGKCLNTQKDPVKGQGVKGSSLKQKSHDDEQLKAQGCEQINTDDVSIIETKASLFKNLKQGTLKQMFLKKAKSDISSDKNEKQTYGVGSKNGKGDYASLNVPDSEESDTAKTSRQQQDIRKKSEDIESESNVHGSKLPKTSKQGEKLTTTSVEDETADAEETEEKGEVIYKVPYYLENFRTVRDSVLGDAENARLFSDEDMAYIAMFNQLTEPAQKLYVRMFSRKLAWLTMNRLKYPEISDDIPHLVDELHSVKLLILGDKLDDLHTALKILSAPDLKALAKSFHLNSIGTKDKIIELLLKKSQQSSIGSLFMGGAGASTEKTMMTRALSYLGKVCRLEESARAVFIRILMLFSLYHTNFDEDSAGGGQNQLFQMLMANIGRVVYPTYTVERKKPVFKDRAALVRFETALQFELELQMETEKGRWAHAYEVYEKAQSVSLDLKEDQAIQKWDSALPQFLRLYTARSVYLRIDNLGVEILQRLKKYKEAVSLLEEMLTQQLYCVHYRGHWYERLALNLDAHLKSPEKSLEVVKRGLSDERVHSGRRLALYERAKKICEAPKSKFADRMSEFEHDLVIPTPEVTIEGMVISDAGSMGMKYQFVMSGDTDQVTLCAVEELVLEHYKNHGYPEGLHAEGSIISNLFVMFFWDVLFMTIPDVFQGPFQTAPLDLHTQDFYKNRTEAIDERLGWLAQGTEEELVATVGEIWEKHNGEMCQGINWEKFSGPETLQGLVRCMGGKVITGILERFVKNPRHTRSGFPDLTLWNTEKKAFKICEVKGPNDRLSYKQILWIDYLMKLGVDAEVCYVKAVGSKRLKSSSSKH